MTWLPGWNKRIKLTIDQGDIDDVLADFPILIYLSSSSGRKDDDVSCVFDELQSDANRKKIAVTTADGLTQCYVEIEKWDDANEKAWLWVKIPVVASGVDTDLYLYYSRTKADNTTYVGDPNSTPAENVWDGNFKFVSHMRDDPDTSHVRDSTENNGDGTKKGAAEPAVATGKIGDGQDFDGGGDNDDKIVVADAVPIRLAVFTLEAVVEITASPPAVAGYILGKFDVTAKRGFNFWHYNSINNKFYCEMSDGSAWASHLIISTNGYNTPGYYHVVVTNDGSTMNLYIGGVVAATPTAGAVATVGADDLWIGRSVNSDDYTWAGILDEIRLSNIARTPAWIKASYESAWDDLLAFGSEEIQPLKVKINDVFVQIIKGSLIINNRIEERSTAQFTIEDLTGTGSYIQGQEIKIYDPDATLIFSGVIDTPETIRVAPSGGLLHPIRCTDNHYFADKRLAAESYLGAPTVTAKSIVEDLQSKYLTPEGIGTGNVDDGADIVQAVFNYVRVSDALDALAEKSGYTWFIDENKDLYFQARDITPAPWALDGVTNRPLKQSTKKTESNPFYRNRQYIRGGRGTTTEQTEVFIADGDQFAFTVGYPFERVPTSVTVEDLGAQNIGIKGLEVAKDCYWNKGDATLTFEVAPAIGKEVTVVYYGQYPILGLVEEPAEIARQLAVEGAGTGYNDDIAEEPALDEVNAVLDAAQAKLVKYGVIGKRFVYKTTRSGLKPGQLQLITQSAYDLTAEEMLIESVVITSIREQFTYDIVVLQGPVLGSWSKLFQALAKMKQEIIDYLHVGSNQLLIILISTSELWEWDEEVPTPTVFTCTVCDSVVCGGAAPIVC